PHAKAPMMERAITRKFHRPGMWTRSAKANIKPYPRQAARTNKSGAFDDIEGPYSFLLKLLGFAYRSVNNTGQWSECTAEGIISAPAILSDKALDTIL